MFARGLAAATDIPNLAAKGMTGLDVDFGKEVKQALGKKAKAIFIMEISFDILMLMVCIAYYIHTPSSCARLVSSATECLERGIVLRSLTR